MHWSYKLRRHSGGCVRSSWDILRLIVFKQKLQNCFSLNGDGLAHISKDAFFHSHKCFLENLDAMRDYQGEWQSSYGSKILGVLKRINHGVVCWMLPRGDPATLFKRKSCSIKTLIEVLWVPLPRPGVLCLFVQRVFLIIRNKLTNFI